jgi:hypothetical protein
MHCPYCATPLEEFSPECPGCRLDLRRAARLLGPVPRMTEGVTDSTDALNAGEIKRLRRRLDEISRRFPQVRPHIVFRHFADDQPISLYAFWLLNIGPFSTATEKHGDNHHILLLVDPLSGGAAITPGYGLEPFLSDEELEGLLVMAEDAWREKRWLVGAMTLFDGLEALLEQAARRTAEAFDRSVRQASSSL